MASTLPGACDIPECRHHQQLTDIANAIVLSCKAGYAKPDVRIYQAALPPPTMMSTPQSGRGRNMLGSPVAET